MSKSKTLEARTKTKPSHKQLAIKYAHQLEIIHELNQFISSAEKTENILQAALHHIIHTLNYHTAQIYRLSSSGKDLWLYLELGPGSKTVTQQADIFSVEEENIISRAIRKNMPVQGLYGQVEADLESATEVALPLKYGQLAVGVLRIQSNKLDDFDKTDLNFLSSVASLLAVTINNSQTVQRLQDNLQEMEILYGLQHREKLSKQLPATDKNILPGYQYDRTTIALVEADDLPSTAKLAMATEQTGISTSQNKDSKELVAPLKLYGETIGVLGVEDEIEGPEWSTDDIRLLEEVSSQVALAIENSRLLQQTQERTNELSVLFETSRQLSESIDLHQHYQILATQIINYLNANICHVSLLDKARTQLKEIVIKSKTTGAGQVVTIEPDEPWLEAIEDSPIFQQMLERPEVVIEHLEEPAPPFFHPDKIQAYGVKNGNRAGQTGGKENGQELPEHKTHTGAMFPIIVRNRLVGILKVGHFNQYHNYPKNELRLAQAIVDQVTVAIENTQLFEQTQNTLAETQRLYDISRTLVEVTTLEDIFSVVIGNVKIYNVDRISISLLDRDQFGKIEQVTIVANWDRESDRILPVGSQISAAMFPLVEAFSHPPFHPLISKDLSRAEGQDERMDDAFRLFMYKGVGAITIFSAPMFLGSEYKGVLSISTRKPHLYTQEEKRIYQTLADQAIIAIERHRLFDATRRERDRVALLYAATRDFNSAQNLEELLGTLVKSFTLRGDQAETGIDHMSIALISSLEEDNTPRKLDILADWDRQEDISQKAALEEQIIVTKPDFQIDAEDYPFIRQISSESPYEIGPEQLEGAKTYLDKHLGKARSALSIPLTVGNNWLGVLFVANRADSLVLKPDTIDQIIILAGQVAVVIQNLQLVEETQQNLYNSEVLSRLSQELLVADTVEAIYDFCLDAIASTKPDRGVAIFMYDQIEGSVELEIVAVWDNPNQKWPSVPPGSHFSADDLGLNPLLRTGQSIISKEAAKDERFSKTLQQLLVVMQIKSLVAVPIWLNKEVNGFILIGNQKTTTFPLETIRLYENTSRITSGALENLRLFEEAQHRAAQLQTAAEVSQAAASYLDLDRILSESVYLLRDRFGFYHVSIFLVDEYQQYAVVESSTGKIGRQMLAEKHRFEVGGQSIVGTAAGTGKPRIEMDVGKDAVYFDNPLLPDTRSEVALPLIARGRVIGALDVHSTQKGAFKESDITILQSMANQLANAIEAARSFQESKNALQEVSKLHEHYLRDEWSTFLKEQKAATGYRLTEDALVPTHDEDTWTSENHKITVNRAIEAKQPLIVPPSLSPTNGEAMNGRAKAKAFSGNDKSKDDVPDHASPASTVEPAEAATLVAPLTLRGEVVIGAVDFEIPEKDKTWEDDTLKIIEAVTNQAAQVIESTRLFEQTQTAREEAEALYEVARVLVATESEQDMFHTVLSKMLSTLRLTQGGILFFEQDKRFGRLHALFEDGQPVTPDLRVPIEGNLSYNELIETKKPLSIEDVANDPIVANVREINLERNIASMLLVPIIINDEVVGAMGADALGQKHIFTEREVNLVSAMADQLSIMLQNRRLLEETKRRAIQLQASSEVGRVATSILDQDVMLTEAVERIKDHFGFYHAQIFLVDETNQYAVLHKSTGEAGRQLLGAKHRVAVGQHNVVGQVTHRRKSMVVRDIDADASALPFQRNEFLPHSRAELAVPLQVGKTLIGVLDVQSTSPNDFTGEDISAMETLSAQLAIAIQNARAFREQQETAERLKEIDKLKTQFLANMSHELRTPLNSIIGFSRVILKGIDGPLTELQKADLTSIHNSGQHLLGLINNMLDLSKIGAGKMELNFEEIEVEPIIKSVMSTALALVKDKPVRLVQEVPDNLPIVWADPTRLRQITLNLVSNACKFTDDGTVTLRAIAEKEKIVISVTDTGIGIPEEKLDTIFEEFTQVDASTTRKVGGTGLGLPISRHFVEMHKGQIWVNSTLGRGSTFSFAIPIKPTSEAVEVSDDDPVVADVKEEQDKTIVAIDDDVGVITLYKRFLQKQNYKVVRVGNSEDVVDQVKAYAPFAILLDVLMPNKDGWSVLKALKANPFTKDIPVIICSIVSDKNRGFSLGAADYLTKPIVESELVNALKHLDSQQKGQIKVLVIDDQADDILLIRRMLESQANYKIIEASNGKEGLELAKRRNPHLIILDLSMPEMDGFVVVEALKNDEKMYQIPIIIVSAKELTPADHQRLTGQVEVLLRKGIFTETELLADVSQALEQFFKKEAT